jgi:tetratricopeptide (TPR) repeat protein
MDSPGARNNHGADQSERLRVLCRRAEELIGLGRAREALELVKQALGTDPTYAPAHCVRSWALQEVGDYRGSLEAAKLAIHLEPEDEWGHRLRAFAYQESGRPREALAAAREAARLAPDDLGVMDCLSLCARNCGELALAREWAERACELYPEEPRAHELLGTHAAYERNLTQAEACFRTALSLEPCRWSTLHDLGQVRQAQGARREAIALYYQAVQVAPARAATRRVLRRALIAYLWVPRLLALLAAGEIGWLLYRYGRISPALAWGVAAVLFLVGDHFGVRGWLKSLPVPLEALPGSHQSVAAQLVAAAPRPSTKHLRRPLATMWIYATPLVLGAIEIALWQGSPFLALVLLAVCVVGLVVWMTARRRAEAQCATSPAEVAIDEPAVPEATPSNTPSPVTDASLAFDLNSFVLASDLAGPDLEPVWGRSEAPLRSVAKQRARVLLELRRPREALTQLQDEVLADPADDVAWCMVAEAFSDLGEHERSFQAAGLAVELRPFETQCQLWKCRSLLARNQVQEALRAARAALELTRFDVEIRRCLVRALLACDQLDEARQELGHLSAQFPNDADLACLRGNLALKTGNTSRAEGEFRAALAVDRDCREAWAALAELRIGEKLRQDAAHCYYEAAQCAPLEPEYRRQVVSLIDAEADRRQETTTPVFYTLVVFGGVLVYALFVRNAWVMVVAVVLVAVFGARALHANTLRSVFYPMPPEVRAYYDTMKPVQNREDASNIRWSCGCLLALAGILTVLSQLTAHALWPSALRLALVTFLCYLWYYFGSSRSAAPRTDATAFRFPSDTGSTETQTLPSVVAQSPLELGWSQLREANPSGAWETAKQILAVDAGDEEALRLASLAALASGDSAAGLVYARNLATLAPAEASSDMLVRLQFAADGQWAEALAEQSQDSEILSAGLDQLAIWICDLGSAGAMDAVRVIPELAQRLAPSAHQTPQLLGHLANFERRWPDAEAAFRQALVGDPENTIYLSNLAATIAARRRYFQAWRYWNQALRLDPAYEAAALYLQIQLNWALWMTGGTLSLLLGVVGMLPTFTGQLRNDWMPWVTFAGPVLVALLTAAARPLLRRLIAPALPALAPVDRFGAVSMVGFTSVIVLLIIHAFQSLLEIALHPGLFTARWQGAATLSFLAFYFLAVLRKIWPR